MPPVTGRQVQVAMMRSIDYLKNVQSSAGTWPDYAQDGGVTALVTYALMSAGVAPDSPQAATALAALRRVPNEFTYVTALKALAFSAADPKTYAGDIQLCADRLVFFQGGTGGWGYGRCGPALPDPNLDRGPSSPSPTRERRVTFERAPLLPQRAQSERPDASNTQFAILALSEAERAGARVPADVWKKAERFLRASQLPNGGWGYVYHDPDPNEAYGSMTAAVVASLFLCNDRLARQESADATAQRVAAIDKGIDWIAGHYTLSENPGRALAWYYFWLYALERAGVTGGRRTFGDHDWFREGAGLLVNGQRQDGSWTDRLYHDALCLLFLAKGYRPLLVQRLQWEGRWRTDPRDLEHLVRYLGKRVGGDLAAWQTVRSDAPLEDWLAAPILHVTGKGPLRMLAADVARVKQYVEQGGLILFDPEGGDAAFLESVRTLLAEQFRESKLEALPRDHPIYTAVHDVRGTGPAAAGVAGRSIPPLEALNLGCRAAVLVAPKGLGQEWAAEDPARPGAALFVGENLAVYATAGDTLPERLSAAALLALPPDAPPPRGGNRVGQVQHDGDWQPRPYALPSLFKDVAERYGVAIASRPEPVRLSDLGLGRFNVLYMTGHGAFHLSDKEKAGLKDYLDRGGTLWAEACCGRAEFDKAFRSLVKELFPDAPLAELPPDHALYKGKVGTPIYGAAYSPAVQAESPALKRPVLLGLSRAGHLAVIYSPYGLACGLDGLKTYGARTVMPADARRLAVNILLFALAF
ncbi:MAG: DUF4159 domain-containing protein [Planctomycetes bacterium]|nr:DUF4159 domain-containing protein [Planctomycetota bacterium]